MRQTWAALTVSKHKTRYATSQHPGKPRKWRPDTYSMAFDSLIHIQGRHSVFTPKSRTTPWISILSCLLMQQSDTVRDAIQRFEHLRGQGTLMNLVAFGRVLKEAGIQTSIGRMIDAARALEFVNIGSRPDFHIALRSNLVSRKEDIPLFDRVFDAFWLEGHLPELSPRLPQGFEQ